MRNPIFSIVALNVFLLTTSPSTMAQNTNINQTTTTQKNKQKTAFQITKKQAIQNVKSSTNGRIMAIREQNKYFHIRVLEPKGKVVNYRMNRTTGKLRNLTPKNKADKLRNSKEKNH